MTTLLDIIQEFCDRRGLDRPQVVMSTIEGTVRQLRGLANEVVSEIVERPQSWTRLQKEATFVTLAAELQGAITTLAPNGFKAIQPGTMFDRTSQLPVCGPQSAASWQIEKTYATNSTPYHYRLWQGNLFLQPAAAAGLTIAFEYSSDYAIKQNAGTFSRWFVDDEDTFLLGDELLLAGLKWKWLRAQGLSYKQEFDDYEYKLTNALGRENSAPTVNLADGPQSARPGVVVPFGNWPL